MNEYTYAVAWNSKLYKFSNSNKAVLMDEVMTFLRKNNINYSDRDISKAIDRQSRIVSQKKRIGLAEAVSGAKAILRYTTGSSVESSEIQRRSAICAACPLINRLGGCAPCGAAGKIANFVSLLRSTLKLQEPIPNEVKSSYCGVCQCSLALMVVSKMDAFNETTEQNGKRPDNCWVKKSSINYIQ